MIKIFKNAMSKKKPIDSLKKDKKTKLTDIRFFGNVKIAPKLLVSFLIVAFLSAAMGGYASINMKKLSESSRKMHDNILLPVRNAGELQKAFQESTNSYRQLLLNSNKALDSAHLASIKASSNKIPQVIAVIESLLSDSEKLDRLEQVKSSYEAYKPLFDDAIKRYNEGEKDILIEEVSAVSGLRNAERDLQAKIDNIQYAITNDAAKINTDNINTAEDVLTITFIAIAVVFIFAIIIGIVISSDISIPVKRLTGRIKQLALGDIDFKITGGTAKDEVGQMCEAVETILASIRMLTDDTNMLIDAADSGQLSLRADAEKHQGVYRLIVEGINATLDAMIAPIKESTYVLEELAQGNLNINVQGEFFGDFAIIKDGLNGTIAALKGYIGEISEVLGCVSDGILTKSIESDFKGDFAHIKESINKTIRAFNGILKDISHAAEEVAVGAAQLSGGSQQISQGAVEQACAIEQLTNSISEIAGKTKDNADGAALSNKISLEAMKDAAGGDEKMKTLQNAMGEINASSASISKIIKVIDDIAFQTNVLSLNAAVEAARVGAHGKGFAVVAEEVRNLAKRSAKAAQETAVLIKGSISRTEVGTKIADETAVALRRAVEGIEKTVALSGEIAKASGEQATGIAQVDVGIDQLSTVVQNSSATAQQAAAFSQELASQAEQLKSMVGKFQFMHDEAVTEIAYPVDAPYELSEKKQEDVKDFDNTLIPDDNDFGKY